MSTAEQRIGGFAEEAFDARPVDSAEIIDLEEYRQLLAAPELDVAGAETPEAYRDYRLDYKKVQNALASPSGFDALLKEYSPFIRFIAKEYFLAGGTEEDIAQEAMIGFFKAVRDYDGTSSSFKSFAGLCIRRQVITAIKTATRYKHMPLNTYVSFSHTPAGQSEELTLEDALPSVEPTADELIESSDNIRKLLDYIAKNLSPFEADALRLYLDGHPYDVIGEKTNSDFKSVDNALQRVRRKIIAFQSAPEPEPSSLSGYHQYVYSPSTGEDSMFFNNGRATSEKKFRISPEIILSIDADPLSLAKEALAKLKGHGHSGVLDDQTGTFAAPKPKLQSASFWRGL